MDNNKRPTKAHLICHILASNGPMVREDILVAVSKITGTPHKHRSNSSYFQPFHNPNGHYRVCYKADRKSLLATGLIKVLGKKSNTLVYGLTPLGVSKAADYLTMTNQS